MDGHHRRLSRRAAGRHQCADWRACGRVHRHRLWHRRALRRRGAADLHRLRRATAVWPGPVPARQSGAFRAREHRHRIYQRHRGAHCTVASQGLAGPVDRQDAGQFLLSDPRHCVAHRHREPACPGPGRGMPGRAVFVATVVHARLAGAAAPARGPHHSLVCAHSSPRGGPGQPDAAGAPDGIPGGDHWFALWRYSAASTGLCPARFIVGHGAHAGHAHAHHRAAGGHRVAAVCPRGRPTGHRPTPSQARSQPGTHGPGRGQLRCAFLWRHARYRHHRPHRDQPSRGGHHASRGHRACAHAGAHRAGGGAPGAVHPAVGIGWNFAIRGLEHGRVARICTSAQVQQPLPVAHAGHLFPHRGVRPDRGRGSGSGAGLRPVRAAHERAVPCRTSTINAFGGVGHPPGLAVARRAVLWGSQQN